MDSSKINDWLQVVGLFGVIASLLFVGMQMKQDREIAISNAYQNRTTTSVNALAAASSGPELASSLARLREGGFQSLSTTDQIMIQTYLRQFLNIYENVHFQYVGGFIDDEHWQRTINQIDTQLLNESSIPLIRQDIESGIWRSSFSSFLLDRIESRKED